MNTKTVFQSVSSARVGAVQKHNWLLLFFVVACLGAASIPSVSFAQQIKWYPDLSTATAAAREQDKLILMHFTADWCKPCRDLETFVYTSQKVQRAFAQNVVAVKIDVDQNPQLVNEYGVASVPFDVAMTPAGRVVLKRKCPKDSSSYEKMIGSFHTIIRGVDDSKSPALAELKEAIEAQTPMFEGRPTSFTPDAPTHPAPQPSNRSAELKRKSGYVPNPFAQQENPEPNRSAAPQRVVNAFQHANENSLENTTSHPTRNSASTPSAPRRGFISNPTIAQNAFQPAADRSDSLPQRQSDTFVAPGKSLKPGSHQKTGALVINQFQTKNEQNVGNTGLMPAQTIAIGNQADSNQFLPNAQPIAPNKDDFLPPEPPAFVDSSAVSVAQNQARETPASSASVSELASTEANDPPLRNPNRSPKSETTVSSNTDTEYALHGKCPVTLLSESKWVNGDPRWGCIHRDRIYIFSSERHLKLFQADPDANSPILAGFDPVLYEETGRLVDGLEAHGVFMGRSPQQRIVLFANAETRAKFQSAPKRYLEAVRQAMKKTGASSKLMR